MNKKSQPLVSCIMPTNNRRAFVPQAIQYFLRQDYENKELLIVDDGTISVADLVPQNKQVRYIRLEGNRTLGAKRNFCVLESKGDLIMHWDDDDWMAPNRISYQVRELLANNAEVCGLQEMLFYEMETGNAWLYQYPMNAHPWLAGGSLLYTRDFWKKFPFPDMQVASDTKFIWSRKLEHFAVHSDYRFYVAFIHGNNTSTKKTNNKLWHSFQADKLKNIVGEDWPLFFNPYMKEVIPSTEEKKEKIKIAALITTCDRSASLKKIIHDLQQEAEIYDISCFIVDDAILLNGKKNYWKTINTLWSQCRDQDFDYYIQLPDDVELRPQFISKAIQAWENIKDPKKICLNLLLDGHRIGKTCWTNFWPQIQEFSGNRYLKTQWMDLFYICERALFEQLQWNINAVPSSRWIADPKLSSGVGQQISIRLHNKDFHLYQVSESLAEHLTGSSKMNPEIRCREPLKSARLPPVYAGMASIPEREDQLKNTISSIIPYVDRLFLFLNDFTHIPDWLFHHKKVIPFLSWKEDTNMGDAGKFFGLNKIPDEDFYYFTLDDDIIYPPDYIWKMIGKVEKYHCKGIIGCGGYIMKPEVNHFYNDRSNSWHISIENTEDRSVHILHTCLTAWHSSNFRFRYEDCKKANMGDIWLAIAAQKQQVPMILIERPASWVSNQQIPLSKTIFGRYRNNCQEQTNIYNSWQNWKLISAFEVVNT